MDTTLDSTLADDYDEPIWKSRANRSTYEKVSYSKKNTDKFLDKSRADDNRDLFLDLFHEDPNELTCDEKEFEKDLFDGIQSQGNDLNKTKKTTKRKRATKKKNNENPDFLSDKYQRNLVKQKDKLQELFEKTPVYQSLQALKDKPLNIEEVDSSGKVTRRYEYYYDFDKDKHDIVEINDKGDSSRRKDVDESENDEAEVLRNNQKVNRSKKSESSLKRKRSSGKSGDKSASKTNKTPAKSANKKSTSDKSISKSTSNKTPKSAGKLKRKSVADDGQSDQNQRPTRKRSKVNYSEN